MHVVFIANCEQAALARTRTLLDRYAPRIGDRAWGTLITRDALDEVYKALRHQASRHTSVACYRNDAVFGLRLIWIVGNRSHYDAQDRFAVATQGRPRGFPMPFRHAALIARLAGYVHDLGKASRRFQDKLYASRMGIQDKASQSDAIRHEWLSAWLMKHLTSPEHDAAVDAQTLAAAWGAMFQKHREGDGAPDRPSNTNCPPMGCHLNTPLDALLWSVGTHHGGMGGSLTKECGLDGTQHIRGCGSVEDNLTLKQPDAFDPPGARRDAQRWTALFQAINKTAQRIQGLERPAPYWEGVMLLARAALIFADQKVSSETFPATKDKPPESGILFANTKGHLQDSVPTRSIRKKRGAPRAHVRFMDQPLSWHLQEVGDRAGDNIRMFTGEDLPTVDRDLVRTVLAARADPQSRFFWQDRAVDQVRTQPGGQLVFNVASTGAGKTLANLKMAFAMRPDAARLAVAFNLRSLTAQTFAAFQKDLARLGVPGDTFARDFAVLMGEHGVAEKYHDEDEDDVPTDDNYEPNHEHGLEPPPWLAAIAQGRSDNAQSAKKLAKLIASPVLVSTMDWIVAAGEPGQQHRHAKALIRVAHSDVILDEVDSYDVRATVAVMRVVQIAASFGRNVIVSSATLNPELAKGLCLAYAQGRLVQDALFGGRPWHLTLVSDKFAPTSLEAPTVEAADSFYRTTLRTLARRLTTEPVTKRYVIAPVDSVETFASTIADYAAQLHETHAAIPQNLSCRLSIGLVRVANVNRCMAIAETLRADGRFRVTAYHARDVLQRRAWKERHLDDILSRGIDQRWVEALCEAHSEIRDAAGDVRLIVVATPVEEVGRDHDFDWAIIEPSSMHSIIQAAGRVNRHRQRPLADDQINIVLLSRNWRDLEDQGKVGKVFVRPGLEVDDEDGETTHPSHDLNDLMRTTHGRLPDGILDAGLVFDADTRKTCFAQYDENAVAKQVRKAIRIIGREPGFETHFMMKGFSEGEQGYPLRDNQPRLAIHIDRSRNQFFLARQRKTPAAQAHSGIVVTESIPRSGTWLTPQWDDVEMARPDERLFASVPSGNDSVPNRIYLMWHGMRV
ncbi:MAG: HD domain-containing protein [Gammaproteobacteria bacterium]|nr:HD domain-containing protein [Gammaproteobacteria bacterium]